MRGLKILTSGEYPDEWKTGVIQAEVRALAHHQCEQCGMAFQEGTNLAVSVKRKNGQPFIGTVHHLDGNKSNCELANLIFLCRRCHFRLHVYGWIPGQELPLPWRNQPPAWVIQRGLPYRFNRQLVLLEA